MKVFAFGRDVAKALSALGSQHAAVSRVARIEGRVQVAVIHLGPAGTVGRHAAVVNQLFMVVAGNGWVEGGDGKRVAVGPGRAAFWAAGEEHASGTDAGLIAVVIEAKDLNPDAFMTPA